MTTRLDKKIYVVRYDQSDPANSFRAAARAALTEIVAANSLTGSLRLTHCAKMPGEKATDSGIYSFDFDSNRIDDAVFDLYYRHFSQCALALLPPPEFVRGDMKDAPVCILFYPESRQNPSQR